MIFHDTILLKIGLAFLAGVIIGVDRERIGKSAGTRTQMLICVGSALLASISIELPKLIGPTGNPMGGDPARLMAQIVAGIGFVGAGVIIKGNKNRVIGITTAATIWVTAAIGLSIGAGFYFPALATMACVLLLSPIAALQYRIGLKVNPYVLIYKSSRSKDVENLLNHSKISWAISGHRDHEVILHIYSSEQKNKKLNRMLESKKIPYSLQMLEE